MPRTIRTEIQKRFSDIDSFRHVNNVSQQMYFDVGKSDFFDRLLGPEILFAPVRIITAATDTSYMGQIRPEDRIAVTTCVERIGTKSLTLLQRIVADDGTVRNQSRHGRLRFRGAAERAGPRRMAQGARSGVSEHRTSGPTAVSTFRHAASGVPGRFRAPSTIRRRRSRRRPAGESDRPSPDAAPGRAS